MREILIAVGIIVALEIVAIFGADLIDDPGPFPDPDGLVAVPP